MLVKQISVFVENSKGRLAEITGVLADNHVNIYALSIADTTQFGILRIITEDPKAAESALKAAGFTVSITDVLSLEIDDRPGGLANALRVLSENEIAVEYAYAYISHTVDKARVVVRVEDIAKASEILNKAGFGA